MGEKQIKKILKEIKGEQQLSPFIDLDLYEQYIKEAEYNINYSSGAKIDYDKDLDARSLLKNYVLYASYKRLAEFKELYIDDYTKLQIKYYKNTNIS